MSSTLKGLFLLLSFGAGLALAKEAQKLDFDEVVVKTMGRNPSQLDTVGVIGRKGKSKLLYQKPTDFTDETRRELKELKSKW